MTSPTNRIATVTSGMPCRKHLVINVGGQNFDVASSTLTDNSSYFESLMSSRRNNDGIDPKPFSILLAYMRSGHLNLPAKDPQLCEAVLLQAEFLGVRRFLKQVKLTTYKRLCHLLGPLDHLPTTEDEVESVFDEKIGSISEAITNGVLPLCYFPPNPTLEIHAHNRVFRVSKVILVKRSVYFARLLVQNPKDYWLEEHNLFEDPLVVEFALQWISWGKFPARRVFEVCGQSPIPGLDPKRQVMLVLMTLMTDVAIFLRYLGAMAKPEEFDKAMQVLAAQVPTS